MNTTSIVDVLIENIKTDQELLSETLQRIEKEKQEKREITERLKDYQKDVSVLLKYADQSQQNKIEELGLDLSRSERGINPIASVALDIVMKSKGNQLTNGELYDTYKKSLKKQADGVSYTEFNIKCRTLFNTQRLLRKKGKDPKSSRDDLISLNGRVVKTEEKPKE